MSLEGILDEMGDIDLEGMEWIVIGRERGDGKGKVDWGGEWVVEIGEEGEREGVGVGC